MTKRETKLESGAAAEAQALTAAVEGQTEGQWVFGGRGTQNVS